MKKTSPEILELRKQVEEKLNKKVKTPKDFIILQSSIWNDNHEIISATTLKRLWGYISGAEEARISTLDILSRYVGLNDWEDFLSNLDKNNGSNPVLSYHIGFEDLEINDFVEVSWKPDRHCVFKYLGDGRFTVVKSENSKLKVGDSFNAILFILNEPLYIDNLIQGNNPPVSFVAGNKGGICELRHLKQ